MNPTLHVEPLQVPMAKEDYCLSKPPSSIALDGYVRGVPWYEPKGPWANFNHHEDVHPLATRATCGQILMALRQGLFRPAHVHVNDCDEDVCLATYLLKNAYQGRTVYNPPLNRLVYMEDALDCTAGSYPFPPDMPILEALAWIFDPYRRFRVSGEIDKKVASSYAGVIEDVWSRITKHIMGEGGTLKLDTTFERVGGGRGWVMVKEIGAQARLGVFGEGHSIYVSVRERPGGRYTYVIGKMFFAPLDLPTTIKALNEAEKAATPGDQWGGSALVMGSPRVGGSALTPEEVTRILNDLMGAP